MYKFKFTLDEIEDVAKSLINEINGVNIILLKGELGTGKTTLIKSILKNLGIEENITSPTFSIVNQYSTSNLLINHFDLYRIKSLKELDIIGFEESFDNELTEYYEILSRSRQHNTSFLNQEEDKELCKKKDFELLRELCSLALEVPKLYELQYLKKNKNRKVA